MSPPLLSGYCIEKPPITAGYCIEKERRHLACLNMCIRIRNKKNTLLRGITFLELMVVLIVLGTLLAVSAPRMKGFHQRNELTTAAREIAAMCRFARGQAILTENPAEIQFDIETDQFWLVLNPDETDPKYSRRWKSKSEKQNPMEEVKNLPRYVRFEEIASDAPLIKKGPSLIRIIYYPNGSATSGYIVLKNIRGNILTIEIPSATGYPEVYSGLPSDIQSRIKQMKDGSLVYEE